MKYVVFTGHRNKLTTESNLRILYQMYKDYIWVSGGAAGFDTQIYEFAERMGIEQKVMKPDYDLYPPKKAPLRRNDTMLDLNPEAVVTNYDGRKGGGTYYTVKEANKRKIPVIRFKTHAIMVGCKAEDKGNT